MTTVTGSKSTTTFGDPLRAFSEPESTPFDRLPPFTPPKSMYPSSMSPFERQEAVSAQMDENTSIGMVLDDLYPDLFRVQNRPDAGRMALEMLLVIKAYYELGGYRLSGPLNADACYEAESGETCSHMHKIQQLMRFLGREEAILMGGTVEMSRTQNFRVYMTYNPILFEATRLFWPSLKDVDQTNTRPRKFNSIMQQKAIFAGVDDMGRFGCMLADSQKAAVSSPDKDVMTEKLERLYVASTQLSPTPDNAGLVLRGPRRMRGEDPISTEGAEEYDIEDTEGEIIDTTTIGIDPLGEPTGHYSPFALLWSLGWTFDQAQKWVDNFIDEPLTYIDRMKRNVINPLLNVIRANMYSLNPPVDRQGNPPLPPLERRAEEYKRAKKITPTGVKYGGQAARLEEQQFFPETSVIYNLDQAAVAKSALSDQVDQAITDIDKRLAELAGTQKSLTPDEYFKKQFFARLADLGLAESAIGLTSTGSVDEEARRAVMSDNPYISLYELYRGRHDQIVTPAIVNEIQTGLDANAHAMLQIHFTVPSLQITSARVTKWLESKEDLDLHGVGTPEEIEVTWEAINPNRRPVREGAKFQMLLLPVGGALDVVKKIVSGSPREYAGKNLYTETSEIVLPAIESLQRVSGKSKVKLLKSSDSVNVGVKVTWMSKIRLQKARETIALIKDANVRDQQLAWLPASPEKPGIGQTLEMRFLPLQSLQAIDEIYHTQAMALCPSEMRGNKRVPVQTKNFRFYSGTGKDRVRLTGTVDSTLIRSLAFAEPSPPIVFLPSDGLPSKTRDSLQEKFAKFASEISGGGLAQPPPGASITRIPDEFVEFPVSGCVVLPRYVFPNELVERVKELTPQKMEAMGRGTAAYVRTKLLSRTLTSLPPSAVTAVLEEKADQSVPFTLSESAFAKLKVAYAIENNISLLASRSDAVQNLIQDNPLTEVPRFAVVNGRRVEIRPNVVALPTSESAWTYVSEMNAVTETPPFFVGISYGLIPIEPKAEYDKRKAAEAAAKEKAKQKEAESNPRKSNIRRSRLLRKSR